MLRKSSVVHGQVEGLGDTLQRRKCDRCPRDPAALCSHLVVHDTRPHYRRFSVKDGSRNLPDEEAHHQYPAISFRAASPVCAAASSSSLHFPPPCDKVTPVKFPQRYTVESLPAYPQHAPINSPLKVTSILPQAARHVANLPDLDFET